MCVFGWRKESRRMRGAEEWSRAVEKGWKRGKRREKRGGKNGEGGGNLENWGEKLGAKWGET